MQKPTRIEIGFGDSFESFKEKYPAIEMQYQPAGANFYKFRWPEKKPATVVFRYGDKDSIALENVLYLMTMELISKSDRGITEIHLQSGITYDATINHDDARLKFHAFLQALLDQGWERVILYSEPRLKGLESIRYLLDDSYYFYPDPTYIPSLKEWRTMKSSGTRWALHADNKAFMQINIQRRDNKTNPDIGVYLMSIQIKNSEEKGRGHFRAEKRTTWRDSDQWKAMRDKQQKVREEKEAELKTQGYTIDETYQDYIIHPDDQLE